VRSIRSIRQPQNRVSADASLALVRQAWEHIAAGDFEALLEIFADDIDWIIPDMPNVPFAGRWRGRNGVQQFFRVVAEVQETLEFTPDQFLAQSETVVVLGRFSNRVKATGKRSNSEWVQVWTARDGKLVKMQEYVDTLAVSSAFNDCD